MVEKATVPLFSYYLPPQKKKKQEMREDEKKKSELELIKGVVGQALRHRSLIERLRVCLFVCCVFSFSARIVYFPCWLFPFFCWLCVRQLLF